MTLLTHPAPKMLMEGILMGECPRWHAGKLWFADWVGQTLYTVTEAGAHESIAKIASLPFSIDWLPDGRLVVVNAAEKKLQVQASDGSFATHADLAPLSDHASNEIVVDDRGNIYVNNINFDMAEGPMEAFEDFQRTGFRPGLIGLLTPDGTLTQVADGLAFPNGMAITANGRTLIVAESFSAELTAFDILPDGGLTGRRVWAKLDGQGADGICIDAEGCVWASSGPRCVRVREGGVVIEEVPLDRMCFACMLGGADGKTLFMVCNEWTGSINVETPTGRIYATRVDVPHAGYPAAR